jgi:hypothetical protein
MLFIIKIRILSSPPYRKKRLSTFQIFFLFTLFTIFFLFPRFHYFLIVLFAIKKILKY